MLNEKTKCLPKYLEHVYEYHSTDEGRSYWCCWRCGDVIFEFEDTGAGG